MQAHVPSATGVPIPLSPTLPIYVINTVTLLELFKRTRDWKARFMFEILGLDISHRNVVAGSRAGPHSSAQSLGSFLSIPPVAIPLCVSAIWAPVL